MYVYSEYLSCGYPCTTITCRPCPYTITGVKSSGRREWQVIQSSCCAPVVAASQPASPLNKSHSITLPSQLDQQPNIPPPHLIFVFVFQFSCSNTNPPFPNDQSTVTLLLFLPSRVPSTPSCVCRGYSKVGRLKAFTSVTSECNTIIYDLPNQTLFTLIILAYFSYASRLLLRACALVLLVHAQNLLLTDKSNYFLVFGILRL